MPFSAECLFSHVTSNHDYRMRQFQSAGLYVVTSRSVSRGRTTERIIECALAAGVRAIQLREKELTTRELTDLALRAREMTAEADALLIIDDRIDVALAVGADGVHLGAEDLPVEGARRIAPELIVGASSHSVEEALAAWRSGASYVNVGPVFPTSTKEWSGDFVGLETVRRAAAAVGVPLSVMGGIRKEHVASLIAAGACVIAVISAVTAAEDPRSAATELLAEIARARTDMCELRHGTRYPAHINPTVGGAR